jgi:hypothetical protein
MTVAFQDTSMWRTHALQPSHMVARKSQKQMQDIVEAETQLRESHLESMPALVIICHGYRGRRQIMME